MEHSIGPRVYSAASSLNLLRTVADLTASGVNELPSEPERVIIAGLETPLVISSSAPLDWLSAMLPSEQLLRELIALALDEAIIGHECVDRDALWRRLATVIGDSSGLESPANRSILALVYALLSLGEWYKAAAESYSSGTPANPSTPKGYEIPSPTLRTTIIYQSADYPTSVQACALCIKSENSTILILFEH